MFYRSPLAGMTEVQSTTLTQNNSTTVDVLATGSSFQPDANATYFVEVFGSAYAAATTNGLRWRIGDGVSDNTSSFAFHGEARASATGVSDAVFTGVESPGSVTSVLGTAGPTSTVGAPFSGYAFVTTGATPPEVGVYFRAEEATNVSIPVVYIRYKRIA